MEKPVYPILGPKNDKRIKLTDEDKARIKLLASQGFSDRKIALEFGVHYTTIRYWLGDKERQNKKTMRRLKLAPPSKEVLAKRRKDCYIHRKEVHGDDVVKKFQREYVAATRKGYEDHRTTCTVCKYRYSRRLHKKCPKCV